MALKLGKTVLIEIISIVQKGLLVQADISDLLRKIEVVPLGDVVELTDDYMDPGPDEESSV